MQNALVVAGVFALVACGRMDSDLDASTSAAPAGCYIQTCDGPRFCSAFVGAGTAGCGVGDGCNECFCEDAGGAHLLDAGAAACL